MSSLSIAGGCLATSFLISRYSTLTSSLLTTFPYAVVLCARVTYLVVLYPYLFSPLRHLPSPAGGHFLMGHFAEIFHQPTGVLQIGYMRSMPNRGVIRYRALRNAERLMPTSPEMLKEVLHTQSYTFVKPEFMRSGIGRVFGPTGLLFAEGDEHRYQRKLLMPAFSYGQIKARVPTFWERSVQLRAKIEQVIAVTGKKGDWGKEEAVVEMAS